MAYIGSSPTKVVSRQSANIFTYTATANQTAFTGADANGNTLACSPSDIMVHMNGIKLEESDYTASTTTVTLGSGAAAGDEVTITAFVTFESADHYTKSAADTRYVNTTGDTMTGNLGINVSPTAALDVRRSDADGKIAEFHQNGGYGFELSSSQTEARLRSGYLQAMSITTDAGSGAAERMRISKEGYVTNPNQPMFYGTRASTQSTTGNQNASNPIEFPTSTTIISSTHWSHSNHRFTAPVTGNYMFEWGYATNQPEGQSVYRTFLWKNGSKQLWTQLRNDSNGHTGYNYASRGALLPLTANDYVHLNSSTDAGYPFYGDSTLRVHLSIFLVG